MKYEFDAISPEELNTVAQQIINGMEQVTVKLQEQIDSVVTFTQAQQVKLQELFPKPPRTIAKRLHAMAIGNKAYDDPVWQQQIARFSSATLGFYPGWKGDSNGEKVREAVQAIKALNPNIFLGQYTVLNESQDASSTYASSDKARKLDEMGWWLKKADGSRTQWTTEYAAWDVNFTSWTKPDAEGLRYPQWLARRDNKMIFEAVPEMDIWFCDNVMRQSRVSVADWTCAGTDNMASDPIMQKAHRLGHVAHWDEIRRLQPWLEIAGNVDSDLSQTEFTGKLDIAFLEGSAGKSWSTDLKQGWQAMFDRYRRAQKNARKYAILHGFGNQTDYASLRYLLATALLDDGYFGYSTLQYSYKTLPWYDEYDLPLGAPLEPFWTLGTFRGRRYEHAMVVVNTDKMSAATQPMPPGWKRFVGTQDPVNNGEVVQKLTLGPRDGAVLIRK